VLKDPKSPYRWFGLGAIVLVVVFGAFTLMASIQARSPLVRLTEQLTNNGKFERLDLKWQSEWSLDALEVAPWDSAERLAQVDPYTDLLVINLWATWCEPCRAELPAMLKLARRMNNGRTWFVFVGYDEGWDAPRSLLRKVLNALPKNVILLRDPKGSAGGEQDADTLWHRMGATGIPETFFVNKGRVYSKVVGAINWEQRLIREYLDQLKRP
jgi:thiol-disulfide isomerase/thioredoxin